MRSRRQRVLLLVLAVVIPVCLFQSATAQTWDAPAHSLAEKIVARAQSRSAVSLDVRNVSSLPSGGVADVRRAVENQLRALGVRLVNPEQAVDEVRLTLSENVRGYLWVAEVGHGDSWDVVMTTAAALPVPERAVLPLVLRRVPLISEPERILDVGGDPAGSLLVLDEEKVASFKLENGRWTLQESAPITHPHPWPRDLRGRLVRRPDGSFAAYLPGVQCSGTVHPQLTATCAENDDPWPLATDPPVNAFFGAARNFFNGTLVAQAGDAHLPPFFSAAMLSPGATWAVAAQDGTARLVGARGELLATMPGWGSDLAMVRSNCGAGTQLLATRAGDYGLPDAVQVYEFVNREAEEAGLPVEFSGPVAALWPAPDSTSAAVVAHNLKTGHYEAFTLSIACGR